MERPSKRPRLSIFNRSPSDTDLNNARYNNDMTLKGRFESIFEKYSQDFTNIGDEIDLMSGEIVINNGHLESIETETDPGLNHLAGDFTSTGRSMLRAMTVTLNPDLPGPDDVLMSIETIAENAAYPDDLSSIGSDDDLFDQSRASSGSGMTSSADGVEEEYFGRDIEPYNSDTDSLFEEDERQRSRSVDSLFKGDHDDQSPHRQIPQTSSSLRDRGSSTVHTIDDDENIIAKFGPYMGKEVLHLIGQRQEAHIEPAWRIPVKLNKAPVRQMTPQSTNVSSYEGSPKGRRNVSLWNLPKARKKRTSKSNGQTQDSREESIDPLQEDSNDTSILRIAYQQHEDQDSDSDFEPEDEVTQDTVYEATSSGSCPYCHSSFTTKSGVMAHWDRCLRHAEKKIKENDPHDYDVMRKIRSKALIRIRYPRLVVYDFRTMVELHEGAGLSFDEIVSSKSLRTRKTGLQLQAVYNRHRSLANSDGAPPKSQPWSRSEDDALQEMCKNPLATITTLRRGLKGRDELQIGNHLAEKWLAQLRLASAQTGSDAAQMGSKNIPGPTTWKSRTSATEHTLSGRASRIKQESDDELFG